MHRVCQIKKRAKEFVSTERSANSISTVNAFQKCSLNTNEVAKSSQPKINKQWVSVQDEIKYVSINSISLTNDEIPPNISKIKINSEGFVDGVEKYIIIILTICFAMYYDIKNNLYPVREYFTLHANSVESSSMNLRAALKSHLSTFKNQNQWTFKIRKVVSTINSIITTTTGYSSYFLRYGKELIHDAKKYLNVHNIKQQVETIDDVREKNNIQTRLIQNQAREINDKRFRKNGNICNLRAKSKKFRVIHQIYINHKIWTNKITSLALSWWKSKLLKILLEKLKAIHKLNL